MDKPSEKKENGKKKVTYEVALKEVHSWLEHKKVSESKIEDSEDNIENLAKSICDGLLTLDGDFNFTQTLKWVIGKEGSVTHLVFKPRLKGGEIENRLQNVKAGNMQGMLNAYICGLTGENSVVVKDIDTEDGRVANAIASFFL